MAPSTEDQIKQLQALASVMQHRQLSMEEDLNTVQINYHALWLALRRCETDRAKMQSIINSLQGKPEEESRPIEGFSMA
ncbi:hypothetical protein ACGF07_26160 [Kitasatospora sp. NPDC048194]|uniref:hypothetical protein n=1 Tax=Kitasatospora sp. NPDC048194 TaxID=3364045 RepID=UPI00371565DA